MVQDSAHTDKDKLGKVLFSIHRTICSDHHFIVSIRTIFILLLTSTGLIISEILFDKSSSLSFPLFQEVL